MEEKVGLIPWVLSMYLKHARKDIVYVILLTEHSCELAMASATMLVALKNDAEMDSDSTLLMTI